MGYGCTFRGAWCGSSRYCWLQLPFDRVHLHHYVQSDVCCCSPELRLLHGEGSLWEWDRGLVVATVSGTVQFCLPMLLRADLHTKHTTHCSLLMHLSPSFKQVATEGQPTCELTAVGSALLRMAAALLGVKHGMFMLPLSVAFTFVTDSRSCWLYMLLPYHTTCHTLFHPTSLQVGCRLLAVGLLRLPQALLAAVLPQHLLLGTEGGV